MRGVGPFPFRTLLRRKFDRRGRRPRTTISSETAEGIGEGREHVIEHSCREDSLPCIPVHMEPIDVVHHLTVEEGLRCLADGVSHRTVHRRGDILVVGTDPDGAGVDVGHDRDVTAPPAGDLTHHLNTAE